MILRYIFNYDIALHLHDQIALYNTTFNISLNNDITLSSFNSIQLSYEIFRSDLHENQILCRN